MTDTISTPEEVKKGVINDLKNRHLTQSDVAKSIGISRSSVSTILSSKNYFSEKHAILFSLAFGYERNYLQNGKGELIAKESQYALKAECNYQKRLLNLVCRALDINTIVTPIIVTNGMLDKCKELIKKTVTMQNMLNTFLHYPVNSSTISQYDPSLIESAERLLEPLYNEILSILIKDFDIKIDYN